MSPLGRGLDALIPTRSGPVPQQTITKITEETLQQTGEKVLNIPIEQIEPNPDQPRKTFSHLEMEDLINSIREHGIIQPIILTKTSDQHYQIVAGERRWRAAKILEFKNMPAIVRAFDKMEKLEVSLLENIQRQDLNPMERARAYQRLLDEFNLTQEEMAKRLGKARATVTNTLRLLTLPEVVQQAIEAGRISEGHAKVLLSLENLEKQESFLKRILGLGLTVRETERLIQGHTLKKASTMDQSVIEQQQKLKEKLGINVKLIKKQKGGKIILECADDEDLASVINKLLGL